MFKMRLLNDPYTYENVEEFTIENDAFQNVNDLFDILDKFVPECYKTEFYATSGPDPWGIIDGYCQKSFTIVASEYKLVNNEEKVINSSEMFFYIKNDEEAKAFFTNCVKRYLEDYHR